MDLNLERKGIYPPFRNVNLTMEKKYFNLNKINYEYKLLNGIMWWINKLYLKGIVKMKLNFLPDGEVSAKWPMEEIKL